MDMKLRVKLQALRLWLSQAPEKDMFHRGLVLTGQDADAIFSEIERLRLGVLREISELESLARMSAKDSATILPFPPRSAS
jgi:hypothetical protein